MTKNLASQLEDDPALAAAARLFRERGFAATTVREIAQAAGMLPGSLHYRYPSKDHLLVALMERGVNRAIEAVRAAVEDEQDPIERLRLGLRAHLTLLLSGDDAIHVVLFDWRSLRGEARDRMIALRDLYDRFWDGLLYAAMGTGRGRQHIDVPLVRLFGFGAMNWVATWYQPEGRWTPEQIADAFWGYLAFGLMAEQARPQDVDAFFRALLPPKRAATPRKSRSPSRPTTKAGGRRVPSPRT